MYQALKLKPHISALIVPCSSLPLLQYFHIASFEWKDFRSDRVTRMYFKDVFFSTYQFCTWALPCQYQIFMFKPMFYTVLWCETIRDDKFSSKWTQMKTNFTETRYVEWSQLYFIITFKWRNSQPEIWHFKGQMQPFKSDYSMHTPWYAASLCNHVTVFVNKLFHFWIFACDTH